MSFVKHVIGAVLGGGLCGNEETSTGKRVYHRMKTTSDTGIQVGVSVSKAQKQEQVRYQRMSDAWRRLRDTASTQGETNSSIASRLTDQSEDYHIGKAISKLLKPEKKATGIVEEHTCCVCLDSVCLGNANITRTSCGHVFHFTCLLKSLKVKNTCPMCRWELEDSRPNHHPANVLTPVSSEQIISEEISYFPIAAHAQNITTSRHPRRCVKEMLRVFGFTLLRTVAEYIHEDNMPPGWYDDGDSSDNSEDGSNDEEDGESDIVTESGDDDSRGEEEVDDADDDVQGDHANANGFSDPDPDPYDDINDQIHDTRGSNGNLRVINTWSYTTSNHPAPPPNEDLRESLNRI